MKRLKKVSVDVAYDRDLPTSSAMKRLNPMPTGAIKFPWCFSAASMKIVKTSWAVRIISIMTP